MNLIWILVHSVVFVIQIDVFDRCYNIGSLVQLLDFVDECCFHSRLDNRFRNFGGFVSSVLERIAVWTKLNFLAAIKSKNDF